MEQLSRQCDDFHRVCLAFGPLLAFEASLCEGWGSWTRRRCCGGDGEREELCKWVFQGGELGRKHSGALPGGFVIPLPLRLLASPVKAASCEGVMGPQVAPAVGHTQTVSRLSGKGHLHRNWALERQSPCCRLKTGCKARVGGKPTSRSQGGSAGQKTHPVALKEVLRHVHHRPQGLGVGKRL